MIPDQISKENHPGFHLFIGKSIAPITAEILFLIFSAGKD
jgi:hypothetical protein